MGLCAKPKGATLTGPGLGLRFRCPLPRPLPKAAGLWSTLDGVSAFKFESCKFKVLFYVLNVLKEFHTGLSGIGSKSSGGNGGGSV